MKPRNFSHNSSTLNLSKFSNFQSFLHYIKSKFGVTSLFLMKSFFSQNQMFNKSKIHTVISS